MKKLTKLLAIAPLALALVFGTFVKAEDATEGTTKPADKVTEETTKPADKVTEETKEAEKTDATTKADSESNVVVSEKDEETTSKDAPALEEGKVENHDWNITLVDGVNNKVILEKVAGIRVKGTSNSVVKALELAKKVYASPEVVENYFANLHYAGVVLNDVKTDAKSEIQLIYIPEKQPLGVMHALCTCDGKMDTTQPVLTESIMVPFNTDFSKVDLKKLGFSVLNQVSKKLWVLDSIKYVDIFNDSDLIKYVDLNTGKDVPVSVLTHSGHLLVTYKPSNCKMEKKVDAASDEKSEDKNATTEAKKADEKKLPATGSSSSVLVFLSAAVLLGAGLVLVKKH